MKNRLFLLTASALLFSCKKDSNNPIPTACFSQATGCLLTEIRDSVNNSLTTLLEYDNERKIKKLSDFKADNSIEQCTTFTYNCNNVSFDVRDGSNILIESGNYSLNSDGLTTKITTIRQFTSQGEPDISTDNDTLTLTYDSDGLPTKTIWSVYQRNASGITNYWNRSISTLSYENGSLSNTIIDFKEYFDNSLLGYKDEITYTYAPDAPEVKRYGWFFEGALPVIGPKSYGKEAFRKAPEKATKYRTLLGNSTSTNFTTHYSSEINQGGFPIKIRDLGLDGFSPRTRLFVYGLCQ